MGWIHKGEDAGERTWRGMVQHGVVRQGGRGRERERERESEGGYGGTLFM